MPPALPALSALSALGALLLLSVLLGAAERAEACSSRSTPKPRPPAPTPRPNVTFHTYACPPAYAAWYCLNGATCFTVKIAESLMYSCECSDGYMGNRCEFKDLDGSYLPVRQRVVLERASIASGASIAVILVVVVCMAAYVHCQRRRGPGAKAPPSPVQGSHGSHGHAGTLPCRAPSRQALPLSLPPPPGPGRPGRPAPAHGHTPGHAPGHAPSRPPPPALADWPWRAPIVVPVLPVVALHRPCRPPPGPPPGPPPRPPPPQQQPCRAHGAALQC
ncbi:hypothetical protein ONE63_008721 [Megalurothrips usitatus]|uniref:EGF-like domain-containing protein n=1 Tax=Megalurothrips usitatus TaxID=439358 RepID=A0AAV7XTL8_9NEOP|nr:hypothetical protein ONE63_008721 [Megalurothrips usitatus]